MFVVASEPGEPGVLFHGTLSLCLVTSLHIPPVSDLYRATTKYNSKSCTLCPLIV